VDHHDPRIVRRPEALELQSLSAAALAFARRLRALVATALAVVALLVLLPASARAAGNPPGQPQPQSAPPGTPSLVSSMSASPAGFRLTGNQVLAVARRNATVIAELRKYPHLVSYVYTRTYPVWQVSWFTPPSTKRAQIEMVQLYVDDTTGAVTQVWTGYQVAWTMARGYPGAFGRKVTALYIWLPLCLLFIAPFIPWRRRPTLWHLDLLMLLGMSVSLGFFNRADLGLSVPLIYPFMLYFFVRLLLLAWGRGIPRAPLRCVISTRWLAVMLIFLVAFRIGLNVVNSNVIDVGYAGVIGASKVVHGQPVYGNWPSSNSQGDTYGPVNYFAYVPFEAAFGWSGSWDSLPAAHAAAIAFDLLTMAGLMLLGWSVRGPTGGVTLAYLWAAFPFTTYVLCSNSNDALVALLMVVCLLVLRSPPARGFFAGLAALTKYAPLAVAPLMLRGIGPEPWSRAGDEQRAQAVETHDDPARRPDSRAVGPHGRRRRQRRWLRPLLGFAIAYALAIVLPMLRVLVPGNFHAFWEDSIVYQAQRPAPFSIWGFWGGYNQSLRLPQHIWLALVVLLGLSVLVFPRGRRTLVQVAALAGALLIGLQMSVSYWFYLYIVWFFPMVAVALVLAHPEPDAPSRSRPEALRSEPASAAPQLR
jgi:hypothetical protein